MKLKIRSLISYFTTIAVCGLFFSCTHTDVFEKNTTIPGYEWKSSFEIKGNFTVTDTSSAYNTYIVLRHTDAYKYNNIWLNLGIQPPGDSMHFQKIDVTLATDANGWMGSGMNDIWEIRQLLFKEAMRFKKPGTYAYSISQIMRDEPLPAVMSAGLRLEKR
jgi:gliding motility-associated lipoprotein GldH